MRRMLAVVVALIATAACGSGTTAPPDPAASEPAPTTTSVAPTTGGTTPTTAITTAPTTVAPRLSAASRLGVDGVGPIQIGMTVDQARAAAGVDLTTERLPHCMVVRIPDGPPGVELFVTTPTSGRIDLIVVKEPPVATISGIRVGSTEADVLATYGTRVRAVNPSLPVHRLVYDAGDRAVVFVIDGSRVVSMYSGLRDQAEADEICA